MTHEILGVSEVASLVGDGILNRSQFKPSQQCSAVLSSAPQFSAVLRGYATLSEATMLAQPQQM